MSGPVALKGYRDIMDGDIQLLNNFELHPDPTLKFDNVIRFNHIANIQDNLETINISAFRWNEHLHTPNAISCAIIQVLSISLSLQNNTEDVFGRKRFL